MFEPEISIADRKVGPLHPPYIICELSANHNGSLERAIKMIEVAAETGADAIKVQTYTADTLTIDCDRPEFQIKGGLWDGYTLYKLYREAYTPYEWHPALFERARKLGVTIFSTPFDDSAVELLAALNAPAYKIASFEAIDLPLITRVARECKPMIISTGMAGLGEIESAIKSARDGGADGVALLHCTSAYPAPIEAANVCTVPHLAAAFGVVSGLSDHTPGTAAAVAAVALGASIIEKHFTLSRADGGPDAAFSLEPDEFKRLTQDCKSAWTALGKVDYSQTGAEKDSAVFRRSLYVVPKVLGRRAVRDLPRGHALAWSDLNHP